MMVMIAFNSCARRRGSGGGGGREVRSKKGMPNMNSDVRNGRCHRSLSVRGVECEEQRRDERWHGVILHRRDRRE